MTWPDADPPTSPPGAGPAGPPPPPPPPPGPPGPAPGAPPWGPAAPDPVWTPVAPAPRRGRALLAVALVVTLVTGLGGAALLVLGRDSGPSHPDQWDPRVADLVAFVEDARGLEFEHPVQVDLLAEADFLAEVRRDRDSDSDSQLDAQLSGMFRALGLAEGDFDLRGESETLTDVGTLAFYRFSDQRVIVRGTSLDVATRVTVVHELTHALQDQHFDLAAIQEAGSAEFAADPTTLIEGDAIRIENAYVESLDSDEQREYERQSDDAVDDDALDEIPVVLQLLLGAPYAFGELWVQTLADDGGDAAVDDAFDDPPAIDEHYFDPASFDRRTTAREAPQLPDLADDEETVLPDDELGPLGWLLVLGEQMDGRVAMEATLGWGGDRMRVIDRDGQVCVQVTYVGDSATDTDEMLAALERWQESVPFRAETELEDRDDHLWFETCDPGARVEGIVTERGQQAFARQFVRLTTIAGLVADDTTLEAATCFADVLAVTVTDAELRADELGDATNEVLFGAAVDCEING